ncbi:MAG: hypothetical protein R3C97_14540 [Geminicoccaceae bacterium]
MNLAMNLPAARSMSATMRLAPAGDNTAPRLSVNRYARSVNPRHAASLQQAGEIPNSNLAAVDDMPGFGIFRVSIIHLETPPVGQV